MKEQGERYYVLTYENGKMRYVSQAPVAHDCNPCYSGSRDKKDHGSKPAQSNSL
jgi:hypothetical protein